MAKPSPARRRIFRPAITQSSASSSFRERPPKPPSNRTPVTGKLLEFAGSAPIETAGWSLPVSQSTPTSLGAASGPGDLAILFGAGIACRWTGIPRPEPAALGVLVAQNAALLLSILTGSPPGVLVEQKFDLWDDQDTGNKRRCQLLTGRPAGQPLTYALAGTTEIVEFGAVLDALVDRPLLATGARIPAIFLEGIVALIRNGANHRLFVYSATPDPEVPPGAAPAAYPMALDNALLDVSVPAAIFIDARTGPLFNAAEGLALILFGYLLIELYLPDPYTGGVQLGRGRDVPATPLYGFLLAEIGWTTPAKVAMRLLDTAHAHPATPPTTEASSAPVTPHYFPVQVEPSEPIVPLAQPAAAAEIAPTTNAIGHRRQHHRRRAVAPNTHSAA